MKLNFQRKESKMTEQTKAIFENPQLLREKLSEFFDTGNKKIIEKYAVVGEKMFEKGDKQKLKKYFDKKSTDFWIALILGLVVIFSYFIELFGTEVLNKIAVVAFKVAFNVFLLMLLSNILVLSYRGYTNNFYRMLFCGSAVLFIVHYVLSSVLPYGVFGLVAALGIVVVTLLLDCCFLFTKEIVIENFAQSLDNAVKNAELGKVKKVFFGANNEFNVGEGRNLPMTIFIVGILPFALLVAATIKNKKTGGQIWNQIEQVKTIISPKESKTQSEEEQKTQEKSQTQNQVLLNPIENAKKLLENNQKEKAIGILTKMCDENNGEACFILAQAYTLDDKIKAITFKQKACELGLAQSCFEVGKFYDDNKNGENTLKYYKKACDGDNAPACRELSWIYDKGQYVKRNEIEAITLLNKALRLYEPSCYKEGGFKICQYLAEQYENKKDWKNAIKFYDLACNGGLPVACKIIAEKYEKGLVIQQNLEQAKEYYGKYCDLGFEDGCKEYKRLNNTNSNKSVDQNELANQCDKNNALSCRNLGLMYEDGILNVGNEKQTQIQALKIFDKACNLGDAKSCEHAWWMYSKINVRCEPECVYTPKDDEMYSKYMDRACELDINFCTGD